MARARTIYRRLPGRARKFLGAVTLWMAPDHLLLVEMQAYAESYRRFYFRDIQAIVTRRTDRRLVGSILYVCVILVLATAWAASTSTVVRVIWQIQTGVLLLLFAIHLGLGPTCACHLRTVLQEVELPPLRRLRTARKVLARLRPLIEQAQGTIPAEEILARAGELVEPPARPEAPRPFVPGPPRLIRHDSGRAHEILSFLLFADALTTSIQISTRNPFLDAWGIVLFLGELGVALLALVRQRNTDLGPGIRRFAWATLLYLSGLVLIFMVTTMAEAFRALATGGVSQPPARLEKVESLSIIGSVVLGAMGFGLVRDHRRARRPPGAPS